MTLLGLTAIHTKLNCLYLNLYKMKKLNTHNIVIILAVITIAAGIAYSYYLYSIGQFGRW